MQRILTSFLAAALMMALVVPAATATATKVAVCHYDGITGSYALLMVADKGKAVDKHLGHGDALPGGAVPTMPGYTFDAACVAVADAIPHELTVDAPSAAAGTYAAVIAAYGPSAPSTGVQGSLSVVVGASNPAFPTATPSMGCGPLSGFPAGSIAVIDRGQCTFVEKTQHAQAAGAIAVIIVNNVAGPAITPGGTDPGGIVIPTAMVSQTDGAIVGAGLPATGTLRSTGP